MNRTALRLLLIEDNPDDERLTDFYLRDAFADKYSLSKASRLADGLKLLEHSKFDVILSDINLPDSSGLDTFKHVYGVVSDAPIIILTGLGDESFGVEAVKLGAADFLNKDHLNGAILKRSILYSLERSKLKQELSQYAKNLETKEQQLEEAQRITHIGNWELDLVNKTVVWSDEMYRIYGYAPQGFAVSFEKAMELVAFEDPGNKQKSVQEYLDIAMEQFKETGKLDYLIPRSNSYRMLLSNGKQKSFLGKSKILLNSAGKPIKIIGIVQDITVLKTVEDELRKVNIELEERVAHRTDDLKRTIKELQVEMENRKKYALALQESEKKYRNLVENMNEGVLAVDNDDIIQFVNKQFCLITEYAEQELIGKKASEMLLDDAEKFQMKQRINQRAQGLNDQYECLLKTKSGNYIWTLISATPLMSVDGKVIGSMGIHTDISQRVKYEKALKSEAKFASENPYPLLRFSMKSGKITYSNKAGKKLLRVFSTEKENSLSDKWSGLFMEAYNKDKIIEHEVEIDDHVFICEFVPIRSEEYVNLYGSDITSIKKAEAIVKKLSFVIGKTDNAVIIADKNGKIQWVNDGFIRLSGYTLDDVVETHGEILRHGHKTGLYPQNPFFNKMITEKLSVSYESRNYKKDGTVYWSLSTLTPILNNKEEVESIIVIDSDVTSRKKAEQEMIKATKLAAESVRAKELFLAHMSHEIRTPMNAIMGIVQLMQDMELNPTQKEYLHSLQFAGESLLYIINDILDLSKIGSGKMNIEKIEFNCSDLVDDLMSAMNYRAKEKNILLLTEFQKSIPQKLIGDPIRLNQILTNLLGNAIKFTEKGHVKLIVKEKAASNGDIILRFDVEDTGIGVAKGKQKIIFAAFEQAQMETSRKYGGTGLGLSIVKRLVELQGGTISLVSELGKGSTFSFELTFQMVGKNHRKPEKSIRPAVTSGLAGKEILLVEDNALNQMVASKFLEGMGLKISIAENGVEAINQLKKKDYDIILMDIQMPEMDGYEATYFVRNKLSEAKKNTPILAMTAHAFHDEETKCRQAGMNDYISKPLNKNLLLNKITLLLNPKKTPTT